MRDLAEALLRLATAQPRPDWKALEQTFFHHIYVQCPLTLLETS